MILAGLSMHLGLQDLGYLFVLKVGESIDLVIDIMHVFKTTVDRLIDTGPNRLVDVGTSLVPVVHPIRLLNLPSHPHILLQDLGG